MLLAYAKLTLHDELLDTSVPDDPYLARELVALFPARDARALPGRDREPSPAPRDHRDQLANAIINRGGPACVVRLIDETGADIADHRHGLRGGATNLRPERLNDAIDALDTRIDGAGAARALRGVQDLLLSRIVWFIRNVDFNDGLEAVVARFGPASREIVAGLDTRSAAGLAGRARASVGRT